MYVVFFYLLQLNTLHFDFLIDIIYESQIKIFIGYLYETYLKSIDS